MKSSTNKLRIFAIKNQLLFALFTLFSFYCIGQSSTTTVLSGSFDDPNNWSNGVPNSTNYDVSISHAMTVGSNILISSNSTYTVTNSGSITDPTGGADVSIMINQKNSGGSLVIEGNVEVQGSLNIQQSGALLVRGNDTLTVGDAFFQHDATIVVEEFGVLIINGNLEMKQKNTTVLDGQIFVNGNITAKQNSLITGSGKIQASGTIDLDGSASFFGNSNTCSPGPCEYGTGAGLPVKLMDFRAEQLNAGKVIIRWVTETELNNDRFILEKSFDGHSFKEVGTVAGKGTYTQRSEYSLMDNVEKSVCYYRLTQVDYNGESKTYNPIALSGSKNSQTSHLSISPNPSKIDESISIDFANATKDIVDVEIRELSGRLLYSTSVQQFPISIQLADIPTSGLYLLHVISSTGISTEKLLISK